MNFVLSFDIGLEAGGRYGGELIWAVLGYLFGRAASRQAERRMSYL